MDRTGRAAPARAVRFSVRMPIRYRLPRNPLWFETSTENVSRTGMLFRSESGLEPATEVHVRLQVPLTNRDGEHAEVICKCHVVRTEQARGDSISPAVAVAIENYRLCRKQPPN